MRQWMQRAEDVMLLALKMEKGAAVKECGFRSCKSQ